MSDSRTEDSMSYPDKNPVLVLWYSVQLYDDMKELPYWYRSRNTGDDQQQSQSNLGIVSRE